MNGRTLALLRHEVRVATSDSVSLMTMFVLPVLMMLFLKPIVGVALRNAGFKGISGADQVVPGMSVMFGFFASTLVGYAVFREHSWATWDRLRVSVSSNVFDCSRKVAIPAGLALVADTDALRVSARRSSTFTSVVL